MPRAAPLGAGLLTVLGVALVVAASHHAPSTAGSPIVPTGVYWSRVYEIGLVGAAVAYAIGLVLLRARSAPLRIVLVIAAATQLAPLAAPLLLSRDVYTYWDKGRLEAVHHRNPFVTRPSSLPHDVAFAHVAEDWRDRPTFYGPTMAAVAGGHALVAGDSPRTAAYLYRVLAALSVLAIVGCVSALAPRRSLGTALIGWNPLIALHFAGGGHNDALMMALYVGALWLAHESRPRLAGVVGALGVAVKWIAAVFLPLELLRRPRRLAVTPWIVGGVLVAAVSFALWGIGWLHSISYLRSQANMVSSNSFAWWLSDHVGGARLTWAHAIRYAALAAYAALIYVAWRTGRARIGLMAGILVAATPFLAPWYLVWPASLSAIEEDTAAYAVVVGLTAWFLRDAVLF